MKTKPQPANKNSDGLFCPVCGWHGGDSVRSHMNKTHGIKTATEFKEQFPDCKLSLGWQEKLGPNDPRIQKSVEAMSEYRKGKPSLARLKEGQWSRAGHEACVICGTTDYKHHANGICKSCEIRKNFDGMIIGEGEGSEWTQEEILITKEMWPYFSALEISHTIDKSKKQVQAAANNWGLYEKDKLVPRTTFFRRNLPSKFTPEEEQIVIGSLLGDAYIYSNQGKYFSMRERHSIKQADYVDWKAEKLQRWNTRTCVPIVKWDEWQERKKKEDPEWHYDGGPLYDLWMSPHDIWKQQRELWYPETDDNGVGIKRVPFDLVKKIGPLGLAVWIGDDAGKKDNSGPQLAVCGFTEEERRELMLIIESNFSIKTSAYDLYSRKYDKKYRYIYLSNPDYRNILNKIDGDIKSIKSISHKYKI